MMMKKTLNAALALGLLAALPRCGASGSPAAAASYDYVPPPATTGNKWVHNGIENADGSKCFTLVDEKCSGTDAADYLRYFEAPIFRAGYAEGSTAWVADGSNLWTLDLTDPKAPKRLGVLTGLGHVLALTGAAGRLYVSGGEAGLVVLAVDRADPSKLSVVARLALPGPAMETALSVDGTRAYVACGKAGLVEVDLTTASPKVLRSIAVTGFASSVALSDDTRAVVAACGGLSVVDLVRHRVNGELALDYGPGLPMPLKDVAVQGDVAYLAAGRWGLVVVDISSQPILKGNKTDPDDLLYYGNGVTISHGNVYLAAGDWGVDRAELDSTLKLGLVKPKTFATYCTNAQNPDRQPAPEFRTQLPPPRVQDPLDVVLLGDWLLAMGDASRLGIRAIDIYALDPATGAHTPASRYEEPGLVRGIAAGAGRLALTGKLEGLLAPTTTRSLLSRREKLPVPGARVAAIAGDGRVVSLDNDGRLFVGQRLQAAIPPLVPGLAVEGSDVVGVRQTGEVELLKLGALDVDGRTTRVGRPFQYGVAHAIAGSQVFLASGDWEAAAWLDLKAPADAPSALPAIITTARLEDPTNWRSGPPRRLLATLAGRMAEVVSFGGAAKATLHPLASGVEPKTFEVPPGAYVAAASDGANRLWLVQGDRARYRTVVVEVEFSDFAKPPAVRQRVFLGSAVGVAWLEGRLYVADSEAGVRVLEPGLVYLGAADLGVRR